MSKAEQTAGDSGSVLTDIPARLDRLPWSRFHLLIIIALGITWILDGLEVTIVGSLSGALTDHQALGLSNSEVGLAGSAYVIGAVLGALFFGQLADQFGRKKLFTITVGVYALATLATGFAWDFWSFALFRCLTGAGIGGEYSAINSAIQEFTPPERRGRIDLFVNGSYWIGAAIGALGSVVVLDPALVPAAYGWRLAFMVGGVLSVFIIFLRHFVPESPRWLMTHGRMEEAERVMQEIEARVSNHIPIPDAVLPKRRFHAYAGVALGDLIRALLHHYPRRTLLGLTLMATQAFFYNAIFFTYALVLTVFYKISPAHIGWFMLPFAIGNFLGPLLLGRWFDTIGRKVMISATYGISSILMAITGFLFAAGSLDAVWQTAFWTFNFFFASAGASAAYLTVGECFPLEVRARAISIFYAFGTALGGIAGPALFGILIESGTRSNILWGYLLGAALMLLGAIVEAVIGVHSERKSLEDIATPLSEIRHE